MIRKQIIYKQTEIGEIPVDWTIACLSNYVKVNPKRELSRGIGATYVGMANIQPYERKISSYETKPYGGGSRFINGDTLLARITPCLENGKTVYVDILENDDVGFGSTEFIVLTDKPEKTTSKFAYYLARSPRLKNIAIKSMVGSSGRQRVQVDKLSNSLFAFPELEEQKQIVSILSLLDDKIELNRKVNKTLEEIGKALFKHWFVDFEFPNKNGKPYKSSGGEMVNSELGETPKGWEIKIIDEICETVGGGTPNTKKSEYWKGGTIEWATPSDITSLKSPVIFKTERKITGQGLNDSSAKLLPKGTILLTSRATVGLLAISQIPIATNQGFISIICEDYPSNHFMYFELLRRQLEIINKASGSTFREISKGTFRGMKILLPPKKLHDDFNNVATLVFQQISKNSVENGRLEIIRDSLLPRLMSGRLRV